MLILKVVRRFSSSGSYAHGACSTPLLNKTLGQVLRESAEQCPDQTAVVFPHQNIRRTYQQFFDDCFKCASGLLSLGVQPGDRVGIWAPNLYEWTVTQFGTAMAGTISVNINPAYQSNELEYALRRTGVSTLIASRSFKTQNYYSMLSSICPELSASTEGRLESASLPDLRRVVMIGEDQKGQEGVLSFDSLLQAADGQSDSQLREAEQKVQTDDPVNIQFTSGTTGAPKGATLSHHNILNNACFVGRRTGYHQEKFTICCIPPLYHCLGCVVGALSSAVHAGTIVYPSPSANALEALRAIQNEKCTHIYGTPTMFIDLLNEGRFGEFSYDSLRGGIMAGAPCPTEVCKELVDKMNMREFMIIYGTTENSPVTFQSFTTDSLEARVSSIGKVHDHLEAKVVDHEGKLLQRGEKGELWIRGYCVMLGYWEQKEKTEEVIRSDRWYTTGDLARMDEEGRVQIVGRMKDLVIRGGENIYPTEIEQFLHQHPAIADVQVIGVPDKRMGEELCAWIRLKDGHLLEGRELKEFCQGKLAHFKIPKYLVFKEEQDFPVTVTGKVQKHIIREIATRELGLEDVKSHMN